MSQFKKDELWEQLKTTWENRNEVRQNVIEKLNETKTTVESTAKVLVEHSKTNPVVHEYLLPIMESDKTEKALTKLQQTLGDNKILSGFEKYRKDLIDAKVSKAKVATPTETAAETEETTEPQT